MADIGLDLGDNRTVHYIMQIIYPLTFIHNIIILIFHIFGVSPCRTNRAISRMQRISIFSMIMFMLYTLWNIVTLSEIFDGHSLTVFFDDNCDYITNIAAILFAAAHFTLYFLFFERLFSVFNDSDLQFNKYQIWSSRLCLFIFFTIYTIMVCLYGGNTSYFNKLHDSCSTNYPWWMGIIYAVFDFGMCSYIQILFARRLIMAHFSTLHISYDLDTFGDKRTSMIQSFTDNISLSEDEQSEVLVILTKSTLLTFIAIITNQIALILTAFLKVPSLWLSINSCINCWCIILMFKCHSLYYRNLLCSACSKKMISIQCLYCFSCDCICTIDDGSNSVESNSHINVNIMPNQDRPRHMLELNSTSVSNISSSNMDVDIDLQLQ